MYRFTISRYGEKGAAHPIDRKTERGAVAFTWRWLEKHGCHGDQIEIVKKRCRKPCRTFIYKVRGHKNVRVTAGAKEKAAPFGREPSVVQRRLQLKRVMRKIEENETRRAAQDPTYTPKQEIRL